ncbi:hypothetical protein CEW89_04975 [Celeribacter ethanolicus]|uniref:ATP-grasp domain-containing protein n=1 Tax=Celeribacter ethanolicus TaxID=1758178 RepID=A0A291GA02_9RHOB|nr:hypothetical protein [Celeribacter ethanolicus]ATG46978.1 hypothetical protein CEW89_04975 [Celeribacter ethanolicus]
MPLISLSHLGQDLQKKYVLSCLAEIWQEMGLTVRVGPGFAEDADLCILHHDVTRLSPERVPQAPEGVRVLNGAVRDISKRRYSSLRLEPGADWDGQVIVKSNLNHFGGPEQRNLPRLTRLRLKAQSRLARLNWDLARSLPKKTYPVLDRLDKVPGWVWERDDLLVERFMPEREGDHYCLRGWLFFGSASYGYKLVATDPLVKVRTMVRYEYLDEVPPELQRHREEMGFDFGKFDYVMHDGRAILLDANKTPSFAGDRRSERVLRLARAVEEFLP